LTSSTEQTDLPLSGIRVLDLTHRLAGPTLTQFLGDWGADVIKIEWWHRMDAWRGMISIEHDKDGAQEYNKKSNWLKLNRSKRSLTLNLKEDKAKEIFLELVKKSDVVADNFSAGVMSRLGLGFDDLQKINPRIIVVSLPGFGNYGPHAEYVGNGGTVQGYAGLASLTGYEDDGLPRLSIGIWADPVAGIQAAIGVGMALVAREATGEGQFIELSQAENIVSMIGESVLDYTVNGRVDGPLGNGDLEMAPHGVYKCDGTNSWITIAVASDEEWASFCRVAGRADWLDDTRFASKASRHQHRKLLDELIEDWSQSQDKWELTNRLQAAGVAAAPMVTIEDLHSDRELPRAGFYQHIDYPFLDSYPGPGARLDGSPLQLRIPPPMLGQHNAEILRDLLGYSDEQVEELRKLEVI
jgi:crotonobetainyl-CoA:carnitine CoA-transferase CaiB-like acyl-CoA transferase